MIKQTVKELVDTFLERYQKQFPASSHTFYDGRTAGEIREQIEAVPPEQRTAELIESAMGNKSWTTLKCSECNEEVSQLIVVSGYEEDASLCKDCLQTALNMLD